jgi:trans-aconitate methyltransferase
MVAIASKRLPEASFSCANILEWESEEKFDIVFAFASLVHLDREDMKKAFRKIYALLKNNSLFTFSLKH